MYWVRAFAAKRYPVSRLRIVCVEMKHYKAIKLEKRTWLRYKF